MTAKLELMPMDEFRGRYIRLPKEPSIVRVTNCDECPFLYGASNCMHPGQGTYHFDDGRVMPSQRRVSVLEKNPPPEWCELRKSQATVILEDQTS